MKAKHLTKNAISHKFVFLAVGIAIAIIVAFLICATTKAKAENLPLSTSDNYNIKLSGKGGSLDIIVEGETVDESVWSDGYDVWSQVPEEKKALTDKVSYSLLYGSTQKRTPISSLCIHLCKAVEPEPAHDPQNTSDSLNIEYETFYTMRFNCLWVNGDEKLLFTPWRYSIKISVVNVI